MIGVRCLTWMSAKTLGRCPCWAAVKKVLEVVMMQPLRPPKHDMATKTGTHHENTPIIRSAKVTAVA